MEAGDRAQLTRWRRELATDGACCLRQVFDQRWVEAVRAGLEECAGRPSSLAKTWTGDGGAGRFFQDGFAWNRIEPLRRFVFESPAGPLAAELMGSTRINLYMDHLLVREPGTNKATPWHHDTPYCFVSGEDFCTIWFPVDPIPAGEGLRLVRGSHRWGKMFLPVEFASTKAYAGDPSGPADQHVVPDIDGLPEKYDILSWHLDVGDCVLFYSSMLHSAPAHLPTDRRRRVYSTRWLGDDTRYALRSWSVPPLPVDPGIAPGDRFGGELFPRIV